MWHSVCLVLHLIVWLLFEYYQDYYYEGGGGEVLRVLSQIGPLLSKHSGSYY